jgi:hypothetical protein
MAITDHIILYSDIYMVVSHWEILCEHQLNKLCTYVGTEVIHNFLVEIVGR